MNIKAFTFCLIFQLTRWLIACAAVKMWKSLLTFSLILFVECILKTIREFYISNCSLLTVCRTVLITSCIFLYICIYMYIYEVCVSWPPGCKFSPSNITSQPLHFLWDRKHAVDFNRDWTKHKYNMHKGKVSHQLAWKLIDFKLESVLFTDFISLLFLRQFTVLHFLSWMIQK